MQGAGATTALTAHRELCINGAIAAAEREAQTKGEIKAGEKLSLSKFRAAHKAGREKFLGEYGVKGLANAHLSTTFVAGDGGTQVQPPTTTSGKPLPISERGDGATADAIDLRGFEGNATERLVRHLRKTEQGFEKLPWESQVQRAAELRTTRELVLE